MPVTTSLADAVSGLAAVSGDVYQLDLEGKIVKSLIPSSFLVYKFKFDLQPGSLTVQVAGEHQPYKKHP